MQGNTCKKIWKGEQPHTWQFDWLLKIIKEELWEHAKPVVVFQKDQLWLLIIASTSLQQVENEILAHQLLFSSPTLSQAFYFFSLSPLCRVMKYRVSVLLTRRFLSATNTLGAETTPIVMSLVASLSSSVARTFAVSSEYCVGAKSPPQH